MKKEYISPAIAVVPLLLQGQILNPSPENGGTIGKDDGPGSGGTAGGGESMSAGCQNPWGSNSYTSTLWTSTED